MKPERPEPEEHWQNRQAEELHRQEESFISSNPVLCDENCDPFFIKTDEHGFCKKCFKNLGYVRK